MGAGNDQIYFSNLYSDWFMIAGAEEISIADSTLLLDLTSTTILNPLIDESATVDVSIENVNFLLTADSDVVSSGGDIIVFESQNLNGVDFSNLNIRLNGWTNLNGYFEIDDSSGNDQLIYHFSSGATRGLNVDQAVSMSPTIGSNISLNMMNRISELSEFVEKEVVEQQVKLQFLDC